jgi:hypothetical protein
MKKYPFTSIFSRFGGHQMVIGEGKLSDRNIPQEATFDEIMDQLATPMHGFDYLSSYVCNPSFMGSYLTLPPGSVKIGVLDHEFTEMLLQFEVEVTSHLYLTPTNLPQVYMLTIRTDYSSLKFYMGKIPSSYNMVLCVRLNSCSEQDIKANLGRIMESMVCLLLFEMDAHHYDFTFSPSKTVWGKRIDVDNIQRTMEIVTELTSREELAEHIRLKP